MTKTIALAALLASTSAVAAPDLAPRLTPASAAEINSYCDTMLTQAAAQRTAFEQGTRDTTATTLRQFDGMVRTLGAVSSDAGLVAETAADAARRDAARACQAKAGDANDALYLSVPAYQRLKAINAATLDAGGRQVLMRTLGSFDRNGVTRDAATRAKAAALQSEINKLAIAFDANISNGRKTVSATPAELAGLPADFIAAHPPGKDGLVVISTDYPDLGPVMSYAKSEDLRKRLYFANLTRAYPQNDQVLEQLLAKRDELARLLGRPNFATLALEDKMVGTPGAARAFLEQVSVAADTAAKRDYARMLARLQQDQPGASALTPWNATYVQQLIRKEGYSVDPQEVRQYFAYNNVRDGILQLTRDLFGVEIRPWQTATWDPSVEPYEMVDGGQVIGRFYFDAHPRPGKYNHAAVFPIRMGIAGEQVPIAALVTNFPAGDHRTGLMEHRDVETFLHEFGHMLHVIFSGQQRYSLASMGNVEWDFVEAPSQMLENWVWDYDTLARFAVDKTGKTIPRDLVQRMNKTRYFAEAYGDRRQLGLSNVSLGLHSGPPPADLTDTVRNLDSHYSLVPLPPGTHFEAAFGHLSGYSAFYYTYMWSKAIAVDLYSRFEREGLRNPATARAYRQAVLAPGGSEPAAQLVQGFLGRPLSLDAYKARLAKGN